MTSIYWVTTSIISLFLLLSAYSYFFSVSAIEGIRALGFPDFFRIQLGVMKIPAAILLLLPNIPDVIKHWCYAGAAFFLITALVAHIAHRDSVFISVLLVALILIHGVSYFSFLKMGG